MTGSRFLDVHVGEVETMGKRKIGDPRPGKASWFKIILRWCMAVIMISIAGALLLRAGKGMTNPWLRYPQSIDIQPLTAIHPILSATRIDDYIPSDLFGKSTRNPLNCLIWQIVKQEAFLEVRIVLAPDREAAGRQYQEWESYAAQFGGCQTGGMDDDRFTISNWVRSPIETMINPPSRGIDIKYEDYVSVAVFQKGLLVIDLRERNVSMTSQEKSRIIGAIARELERAQQRGQH